MRLNVLLLCLFCLSFVAGCSETSEPADSGTAAAPEPEQTTGDEVPPDPRPEPAPEVAETDERADPGQAYLYINAQKPGVEVLPSGLQFEILETGEGRSPGPASMVVTHYEGSFIDGTVFDSSIERGKPATFPVNGVIRGWTEALQMMKEGDRWRLVIPPELGYGKRGAGGGRIPGDSVLVFEVELLEVKEG